MGLGAINFLLKTTRKTDFLNNSTIMHYFLPISHFFKQFDSRLPESIFGKFEHFE